MDVHKKDFKWFVKEKVGGTAEGQCLRKIKGPLGLEWYLVRRAPPAGTKQKGKYFPIRWFSNSLKNIV